MQPWFDHTYMILKIHVLVSWQLSKQGMCWPVSCDHITSSGFELIKGTCFCFFFKGWLQTNYWFLLGLWAQVRLICLSAMGCSEGIISLLLCYVVWDCWNSKQRYKQYKQNLTAMLQNSNKNSHLSWISLIRIRATWPRTSTLRLG